MYILTIKKSGSFVDDKPASVQGHGNADNIMVSTTRTIPTIDNGIVLVGSLFLCSFSFCT